MYKIAMFLKSTLMAIVASALLIQMPPAQAQADWQTGGQICQ